MRTAPQPIIAEIDEPVKRFWKKAAVIGGEGAWGIALDGKPLHTPAKRPLLVPSLRLAEAIADEWSSAGEMVDPRAMPLTGLANAAIDRVASDPNGFAADLAAYAASDLLCYRAESPRGLVELQKASWDELLLWARRRFDVEFVVTGGIVHVVQPSATLRQLAHAVQARDPFRLAGLSPLVTIGGSLIAALAVAEGAVAAEQAWDAVTIDEQWQSEEWGADREAEAVLEARRRDFLAAALFLELLKDQ